jgi:hypothetical protein
MSADDSNGRVTLAVLSYKLDNLTALLEKQNAREERNEGRITALETGAATHTQQIKDVCGDVERLQSKDTWGTVVTGFLAVLAGIFGVSR